MITNDSYFKPCKIIEDGIAADLSNLIEGFRVANKSNARKVLIFVNGEFDEYFKGESINGKMSVFKQRF